MQTCKLLFVLFLPTILRGFGQELLSNIVIVKCFDSSRFNLQIGSSKT